MCDTQWHGSGVAKICSRVRHSAKHCSASGKWVGVLVGVLFGGSYGGLTRGRQRVVKECACFGLAHHSFKSMTTRIRRRYMFRPCCMRAWTITPALSKQYESNVAMYPTARLCSQSQLCRWTKNTTISCSVTLIVTACGKVGCYKVVPSERSGPGGDTGQLNLVFLQQVVIKQRIPYGKH